MHYIYVYMIGKTPVYVGETENVLKRNRQHYEKSFWHNKCDSIYFAPVTSQELAEIYESYLINKYDDILYNSQHPDLWKKHHNLPEQLRKLKWHQINLDEINHIKNGSDAARYYWYCYDNKKPYREYIFDMCTKY